MNVKAVFMNVIGDALGSIAVMVSGFIIKYTKGNIRFIADPICSLLIVFIIVSNTLPILKKAYNVLLHCTPEGISILNISNKITQLPTVLNVHDFHVW